MKNIRVIIFIFCILNLLIPKALAQQIFKSKTISISKDKHNLLSKNLKDYDIIQIDIKQIKSYVTNAGDISTFHLKLGNKINDVLTLELNDLRSTDYISQRTTDKGVVLDPVGLTNTYKGFLNYDPKQAVRLTIDDNNIEGYFVKDGEYIYIESLSNLIKGDINNELVLYEGNDIFQKLQNGFFCGVSDSINNSKIIGSETNKISAQPLDCFVLEIATEADFEYFQTHGSNANNQILSILNQVEGIYNSTFAIDFVVSFQNIFETSSDPYSATAVGNILIEFKNEWNANRTDVKRDVAHMWSGKDFDGSALGVAYTHSGDGVVCRFPTLSYALSQDWSSGLFGKIVLTAHEIGHNFSLSHYLGNICSGICTTGTGPIMCPCVQPDALFFSSTSITDMNNYLAAWGSCIQFPADLVLGQLTINSTKVYAATNTITVGNSFEIISPGDVTMVAGSEIIITDIVVTGKLFVFIDPNVDCTIGQLGRLSFNDPSNNENYNEPNEVNNIKNTYYDIFIYPNPNKGIFNISVPSEINFQFAVYIYDILGKLIFKKENTSLSDFQINITDHPKGLYLVKFINNAQVLNGKIIYE